MLETSEFCLNFVRNFISDALHVSPENVLSHLHFLLFRWKFDSSFFGSVSDLRETSWARRENKPINIEINDWKMICDFFLARQQKQEKKTFQSFKRPWNWFFVRRYTYQVAKETTNFWQITKRLCTSLERNNFESSRKIIKRNYLKSSIVHQFSFSWSFFPCQAACRTPWPYQFPHLYRSRLNLNFC